MKIVAIGCIHNDVENLLRFLDSLSQLDFAVLVCVGDFTDGVLPRGFTSVEIAKLIIEELRGLGKPVLIVPGSWDKDLIEFFEKEKLSVHGRGKIIDGVGFYGFGGAKTPFGLPLEPSEEELSSGLKRAHNDVKDAQYKIQLTHAPPSNTKLDVIASGAHVGSEAVRKFLEDMKPQAAVCAHIHEARGVDEIKDVKILNTGRFPEGHCGFIDVGQHTVTTKIIDLI